MQSSNFSLSAAMVSIGFHMTCAMAMEGDIHPASMQKGNPNPIMASRSELQPPTPGFDCRKAASTVEKTICTDVNLAQMDGELSTIYKHALQRTKQDENLKTQQLNWLRQVRNACADAPCLSKAYQGRINALRQMDTTAGSGIVSPFPATYQGGFTGKERLTLTADGRILEQGIPTGSHQVDWDSPWTKAQYPLLLIRKDAHGVEKRHCKIQPDRMKMFCHEGGSGYSELDRIDPAPKVQPHVATQCDDEQLYLEVMAAARQAKPDLELKGATEIRLHTKTTCQITLYYLKQGQPLDLPATYDLNNHPVRLTFLPMPSQK
ncbi:MAG: DUF1311 domain-containing protein [Magnetococcales bacterium]|nr:DUF1311 domain-containing protein [Magnetococcales bacterium]